MKLLRTDWRFNLHVGNELTVRFADRQNNQHTGIISSIQFIRIGGGDPFTAENEDDVLCYVVFKDGYGCECLLSEMR